MKCQPISAAGELVGYVVQGDSTSVETVSAVNELITDVGLIIADPPYGNIVSEAWDKTKLTDSEFASWMVDWTQAWSGVLAPRGAFYVWGGVGKPGFRPFFKYMTQVERPKKFELANLITWSKRRAYGVQNNYLWTREECAYFIKGDAKKPKTFNVPLLDAKRGYAGYDKKYPAKSEHYRRTNVWTDINEIFKGKLHPTQKQQRLHEVMIEVHTDLGDWVIDPFAGAGTTAMAALKLGRRFVVIENDAACFESIIQRLTCAGATV